MAKLDDLLALFPDNNTRAISAADMREAITQLWTNDEQLLGAIESIDPQDGVSQFQGTWNVNPTPGPQADGQISTDTGQAVDATELYLGVHDNGGATDFTNALMNATRIFVQQQIDSAQWANAEVTGTPSINGQVVTIPVNVLGTSGTIDSTAWQAAIVVIFAAV